MSSSTRCFVLALLLLWAGGCRAGRDPDALLGVWQNGRDRIEFHPGGILRFHSSLGSRSGTYVQRTPAEIRVDLGTRWPSGEPRYWFAMARGDQLGLCEIHNGRHCMRFARPHSRVRILPR